MAEILDTSIDWLDWSDRAFSRARDERKPVLLRIQAAWCAACRRMEETAWRDAAVAALVRERYVPVSVDCDRRPDVSDRYSLGGWPTTAFLTPGGELLGGDTRMTVERLRALLQDVAEAFVIRGREIDEMTAAAVRHRAAPAVRTEAPLPRAGEAHRAADGVLAALCTGRGANAASLVAHPDALHLAIDRAARQDGDAWGPAVAGVLEDLALTLRDPVHGGFFRCPPERGGAGTGSEKLLAGNAHVLQVYLHAWRKLDWSFCRDVALDVVRWTHAVLADRTDGGFFASQAADVAYDASNGTLPHAAVPPSIDRTIFVDGNAAMISAYFDAGAALGDSSLAEFAVAALERVVPEAYRPGAGVAHVAGEAEVRGLLSDQVFACRALLDAEDATGRRFYGELAQEVMEYALRTMWDPATGGFRDRATDLESVGLLGEGLHPPILNGEAARVLVALATSSGESRFVDLSRRTLAAMAAGVVVGSGTADAAAASWVRAFDTVRARP